jgi:hypothetical protein
MKTVITKFIKKKNFKTRLKKQLLFFCVVIFNFFIGETDENDELILESIDELFTIEYFGLEFYLHYTNFMLCLSKLAYLSILYSQKKISTLLNYVQTQASELFEEF